MNNKNTKSAEPIYFTLTETEYWHGSAFLGKPDKEYYVKLVKEPDNEYDREAIKITIPGVGQIGYLANSPYTVISESYSAGRLYDKIGDSAQGKVLHVLPDGVLCVLEE